MFHSIISVGIQYSGRHNLGHNLGGVGTLWSHVHTIEVTWLFLFHDYRLDKIDTGNMGQLCGLLTHLDSLDVVVVDDIQSSMLLLLF